MIFETDLKAGRADVRNLVEDGLVMWQHAWYFRMVGLWGFIVPVVACGVFWGDWMGGVCWAGAMRLTVVHHVS